MSRLLPHDNSAEEAVLGAMLSNPSACETALDILKSDDFYSPKHGEAFGAMLEMTIAGEPVDVVTVGARLPALRGMLAHAQETCLVVGHVKEYARVVKDTAIRREVIKVGNELVEAGYEKGSEDALEAAESLVYALGGSGVRDDAIPLRDLLRDATGRIEEVKAGKRSMGITTHLSDLNALITAIVPGSFNILAARPSTGKTALACDFVRHLSPEMRCLLFSVEMSKEEIVDRLLAAQSIVGLTRIRSGEVTEQDTESITRAVGEMASWRLSIDDSATTMWDIHRRVRKFCQRGDLGLVVIDYIQLLTMGRGKPESRQQEVASISRQLKLMAREFKVPVLALSQLNRPDQKYEREKGKPMKPTLASLRESGALEQDADLVLFLWRPDEANATNVELLVAKNRSGPTGKVPLLFVPHLTKFVGSST